MDLIGSMDLSRLYGNERYIMIQQSLQDIQNGSSDALVSLANYYNYVENDYDSAIKYYQIGIEKGSEQCYLHLAEYYKKVAQNDSMALEIWNNGIKSISSTKCMLKLAIHYKNLYEMELAIKYYTMCWEHGDVVGIWQLGLVYQFIIKDYVKMKECLCKAIKQGDYNSAYCLGLYYKEISNYDVMKRYFLLAAWQNHNLAIYDLAQHYELGENNIPMAIKYYIKGAQIGDAKCIEILKNHHQNNLSSSLDV